MDALRRVYQRVVQIPLENLEQLWSEYNSFEVGLNKITVSSFSDTKRLSDIFVHPVCNTF